MEALNGKSPADSKGENVVPEQIWLIQEEHCDHVVDRLSRVKSVGRPEDGQGWLEEKCGLARGWPIASAKS